MGKKKQKEQIGEVFKGRVIRSVGSTVRVQIENGEWYDCVIRGKFRIKGLKTTNPVAVGDEVMFSKPTEESEVGVVREVVERKNYILRKAIGHNHKVHILAANVDQAILIFTVDFPPTSTGFANRFLFITEAYDIPAIVLINKVDLLETPEHQERLTEVCHIYQQAGYQVEKVSALDTSYAEKIKNLFKDKITFIGGHSGAGKSTLVNLVDPDLDIKTAVVSDYNRKGKHTTTYAEIHPLKDGGFVIDSPGIKEFGLTGFDKYELRHYFPEMKARLNECRFNDCMHVNEPGCAVKAAVESGEIHPSRYDTYLRMLDEIEQQ
ncbi:MAG: ribosome small subunit-dependent GTPase A [Bacteroidota bacterium]